AVATGLSLLQTPVYQGTAELLVEARAADPVLDNSNTVKVDPNRAIQTQIQIMQSRPVADKVKAALGNVPNVQVNAVGSTDVIKVSANSTSARRAADVANAYANAYVDFRQTQNVDDLLNASKAIQQRIDDLQKQIDDINARINTAADPQKIQLTNQLRPQLDSLVSQQALYKNRLGEIQVASTVQSGGA